MRHLTIVLGFLLAASAFAQPFVYSVDEFAGRKLAIDGVLARDAAISPTLCVARDRDGNIYICASSNGALYRVSPDNRLKTVFGSGIAGFSSGGPRDFGDGGPATEAHGVPIDAAVDAEGNIYFVQTRSSRVRKISADGTVTTVAGGNGDGFSGDGGLAAEAQLRLPRGIAIAADGSIYVSDSGNERIRRIDRDGVIDTIAGGGGDDQFGEGLQATEARVVSPRGLDIDSDGNIYFVEFALHRVRQISTTGIITTVTGTTSRGFGGDGGAGALRVTELSQGCGSCFGWVSLYC